MGQFSRFLIALLLLVVSGISGGVQADGTVYQYWADENYPPFEYKDSSGTAAGFSVDIIRAVAEEMGFSLDAKAVPWSEVKQALTDNTIDLSGTMVYDVNRTEHFVFSAPILTISWFIYVPDGSSIRSIDDLKGRKIVVAKGDIWEEKLTNSKFPADLFIVEDYRSQLKELSTGLYDAAIINKPTASYLMEIEKITNIKPVGGPLENLQICIAGHKSNPGLINQINEGLLLLSRNGKYDEISHKWFAPHQRAFEAEVYTKVLLYVLIPVASVIFLILFWLWSLRKMVYLKTFELEQELARRKKAESALRDSESRFRTLFEAMNEGVAIYDLIMDEEGKPVDYRLIEVNPAYERHTGKKIDEVKGKTGRELYANAPSFFEVFFEVITTGRSKTFEAQYEPTNQVFQVSVFFPRPGSFATIFVDISKLKILEKERASSLSQIEKNLAEFMVLNDEIRNPLNVIAALGELTTPEISERILKEVLRVDTLINRLDIRWLESEKVMRYLRRHHGIEFNKGDEISRDGSPLVRDEESPLA